MERQENIPEFKVIIQSDKTITVENNIPELGDVKNAEVNLDSLKKHTIQVLIGMLRDNRLNSADEFQVVGANLFSVLFYDKNGQPNSVGEALNTALDYSEKAKLLRIQLVFKSDDVEPSKLAAWPWEYLYNPTQSNLGGTGYFLSASSKLVLVRYLPLEKKRRPLLVKIPPVKILFVASSPHGHPQVQYESVLEALHDLERESEGRLKVIEVLGRYIGPNEAKEPDEKYATFDRFIETVRSIEPHVIHFVGHGRVFQGSGQIAFMQEDGSADWVTEEYFSHSLWDLHEEYLRLVFLQACETAQLSNPYGAISGVAQQLAYKNIPAVVAMQYEIKNQIANNFTRAFYSALANSKYIDEAVQIGREKIAAAERKISSMNYSFALPVLYMRQAGGLLDLISSMPSSAAPSNVVHSSSCPHCDNPFKSSAKVCGFCGAELVCPRCGISVTEKLNFCTECAYAFLGRQDKLNTNQIEGDALTIGKKKPTLGK